MSRTGRIYASSSQPRTGLVLRPFCLVADLDACGLSAPIWKKVAAAFSIMIGGKKELQDHIFASLTYIIAHFRRCAIILGEISTFFCVCLKRRSYGLSLVFARIDTWTLHIFYSLSLSIPLSKVSSYGL
jgi:hypothetical protein